MRTRKPRKTRVNVGSNRKTKKTIKGKELFGQLVQELRADDRSGHRYGESLRNADPDRSSLLTAHIIVERLIESTLETRLPFPDFWIPTVDFGSKVRLARALGLIREEEHCVCSVLNSARNALAHKLEPLPQKWREELKRLSFRAPWEPSEDRDSLQLILRKLVTIILARREHMMFHHRRFMLREENGQRWFEVMKQKIGEAFMSEDVFDEELLQLQVDLQIAREVNKMKS